MFVFLARPEQTAGEIGLVGSVREKLSFETDAAPSRVGLAFEVIGGVDLDAWHGGGDGHDAATVWIGQGCEGRQIVGPDGKAMVVAPAVDLLYLGSDAFCGVEVKGRSGDGQQVTDRDFSLIDGEDFVAGHCEGVVEHIAGASEIKIGVIGEIDMSRLVGRGLVFDSEHVFLSESVGDRRRQGAGVAFFAVRTDQAERNTRAVCCFFT